MPVVAQLTEAQQRLAVTYMPLARSLARPFKEQLPASWDEFESAALMALVESARSFDPDLEVKFSTFARWRIQGALRDARRRALGYARPAGRDGGAVVPLSRDAEERGRPLFAAPGDPVGSELEAVEAVESWLAKLPRNHAAACRLIYLHGKTHAEAGEALGVSPSRVTFMHLESLAMLGDRWPAGRPR